jgi:hypothetical protein
MVKLVENFVQTPIRLPGAAGIGQDGLQQPRRYARDFQPKVPAQWFQASHGAGGNGQNRLEKIRFGPDKNAVPGQNLLVGQRIIGRQGITVMNMISDQVIEHG